MTILKRIQFCVFVVSLATSFANAQNESGKFRFYETKELRGEETYQITQSPNGELTVQAKTDLPFAQQEKNPLLNLTLRTSKDLTPLSFSIKGPTLLEIEEDTSISVQGTTANFLDRGQNKSVQVSANFFSMSGCLPLTLEMMLVRYWLAHGRPRSIPLLPAGEAFVELRGKDVVTISGRSVELTRYHLRGKNWRAGWARQTLWLDGENRLVAAINLGSEIESNLYAFREGYESSTTFFLERAVNDAIERLTQLANELSPKGSSSLTLVGGTLIDATGNPPVPNAVVLIQGDRIVAAGPRSSVTIPTGARIVDVTGKFLLPGLWDMHAHLYQTEFGPTYLAAGITSARDVGNDIETATALRDAAKEKRGLGPRLLLAGYIDGKNEGKTFDVQVETAEEAQAAVRRYKNAGYEQIKIRDAVKLETLKAICAEAHRLGMTVTGHVPEGLNAYQAVEAGMDQISHLSYVETAFFPKLEHNGLEGSINLNGRNTVKALKFFKDHGTVVDATDAVIELMLRPMNVPIESFEPGLSKVPAELTVQINKKGESAAQGEALRMVMDVLLKITGALHRAGVPIVAGTDVGVPGHTLHRELELYVKAGFTPLEAIQAATIVPARVMKLDQEVGTIESGKRADLLIVDANPLDNISNIRKGRFVVTQGRLFDCAKLWESVGFKP
ncbi:MAG TPA: amidohydrolase family protein [Pyrinomonadaceae bacterium]|jgi:imidazolonepropionase-like amidohydrolase|nr:amidohydrolase family protein [Pyrinomonadaceae bacterium]